MQYICNEKSAFNFSKNFIFLQTNFILLLYVTNVRQKNSFFSCRVHMFTAYYVLFPLLLLLKYAKYKRKKLTKKSPKENI